MIKDDLQIVLGAVATKELVPLLTHIHNYSEHGRGRMQGTNGRVTIDSSSSVDMYFTVPAEKYYRAIVACDDEAKLKITDNKKLSVSKGKTRILLPLASDEEFPLESPTQGKAKKLGGVLSMLNTIRPFIGDDATRPWSCGVLFHDGFAYATNNVVLVKIPFTGWKGTLTIPVFAVDELIRLDDEPFKMTADDNSVTFFYKDGVWLKSVLFSEAWPDLSTMITKCKANKNTKIPELLIEAVQTILPFCPEPKFPKIKFTGDSVSTEDGDMSAQVGGFKMDECSFRAEPLLQVLGVAEYMDFSTYPQPCPFVGDGIEGVIVGLR